MVRSARAGEDVLIANRGEPVARLIAVGKHHGCDALWTNDNRLAQAAHGLAVNVQD